jgi:peptide/nickel transport system substrate-binding protein
LLDDYALKFDLSNPYSGFLDNLTVGILPKHIWGNIAPEKFSLADYNLKPIGSGPYQFFDMQKDSNGNILSYNLKAFEGYFEGRPYISRVIFNFYPDESSMIAAYNKKEVKGIETIVPEDIEKIKNKKSTQIKELSYPRYFSVFFNKNKSVPLANEKVREAISYATDRQEIISEILKGKGVELTSTFLPSMEYFNGDLEKRQFDLERSRKILEDAEWKLKEGESVREKNGTKLEFKIVTADWQDLVETAEILSRQWKEIGVEAKVEILSVSDLQQNYIRTREYDALLFGQVMSFNPDLYPFWHSSQKQDPGFNLSLFNNEKADEILKSVREEKDRGRIIEKYKELQEIINKEIPAIFLYSPYYNYPVSDEIKGIEIKNINSPYWRFSDIEKWYIKTSRVKK